LGGDQAIELMTRLLPQCARRTTLKTETRARNDRNHDPLPPGGAHSSAPVREQSGPFKKSLAIYYRSLARFGDALSFVAVSARRCVVFRVPNNGRRAGSGDPD